MEIRKTLRYCLARVDVATGRARRGFAAKRPRVIDLSLVKAMRWLRRLAREARIIARFVRIPHVWVNP